MLSNAYNLHRKSQIAIEYCYRFRNLHPDAQIFWVHASSAVRFKQAYMQIARTCQLIDRDTQADPLPIVYDWFSNEVSGRWLMILDNADDPQVFFDSTEDTIKASGPGDGIRPILAYVPWQTASGSILITSRYKNVASRLTKYGGGLIHVTSMTPEEATSLVKRMLVDDKSSSEEKRELIERLDFIPLAITQAAAFINEQKMTVPQYSKLLLESNDEFLLWNMGDLDRDPIVPNSIIRTWHMSLNISREMLRQLPIFCL